MKRMLDGWVSSVVMLRLGKSLGGRWAWSRTCGGGSGRGPRTPTWGELGAAPGSHRNIVCTLTMVLASAMYSSSALMVLSLSTTTRLSA